MSNELSTTSDGFSVAEPGGGNYFIDQLREGGYQAYFSAHGYDGYDEVGIFKTADAAKRACERNRDSYV